MGPTGGNRNVSIGGSVTGSSVVTGDGNVVVSTYTKTTLPPPDSVDMAAEIAALRAALAGIGGRPQALIDNALNEADLHLDDTAPDRDAIGGALEKALGYAGKANALADRVDQLAPHVRNACGWLGDTWQRLLPLVGLTV